jgi:hypothetical protein
MPRQSRAKAKRSDPSYIPRPENAFMLFRKATVAAIREQTSIEQRQSNPTLSKVNHHRQADMSKIVSQRWRSLTKDERAVWDERAAAIKCEHAEKYPGYQYHPGNRTASQPLPSRCNVPRSTKVPQQEERSERKVLGSSTSHMVEDNPMPTYISQETISSGLRLPIFGPGFTPNFGELGGSGVCEATDPQLSQPAEGHPEIVSLPSIIVKYI